MTLSELPDYLQKVFENSKKNLNDEEMHTLQELLFEHSGSFSKNSQDLEQTLIVKHRIDTGTAKPIKQRPRRVPLA